MARTKKFNHGQRKKRTQVKSKGKISHHQLRKKQRGGNPVTINLKDDINNLVIVYESEEGSYPCEWWQIVSKNLEGNAIVPTLKIHNFTLDRKILPDPHKHIYLDELKVEADGKWSVYNSGNLEEAFIRYFNFYPNQIKQGERKNVIMNEKKIRHCFTACYLKELTNQYLSYDINALTSYGVHLHKVFGKSNVGGKIDRFVYNDIANPTNSVSIDPEAEFTCELTGKDSGLIINYNSETIVHKLDKKKGRTIPRAQRQNKKIIFEKKSLTRISYLYKCAGECSESHKYNFNLAIYGYYESINLDDIELSIPPSAMKYNAVLAWTDSPVEINRFIVQILEKICTVRERSTTFKEVEHIKPSNIFKIISKTGEDQMFNKCYYYYPDIDEVINKVESCGENIYHVFNYLEKWVPNDPTNSTVTISYIPLTLKHDHQIYKFDIVETIHKVHFNLETNFEYSIDPDIAKMMIESKPELNSKFSRDGYNFSLLCFLLYLVKSISYYTSVTRQLAVTLKHEFDNGDVDLALTAYSQARSGRKKLDDEASKALSPTPEEEQEHASQ